MHYIPKYSRERQNKRQSQKFVTVIDKEKFAKSLDENKLIVTNLRADTLKEVKLRRKTSWFQRCLQFFRFFLKSKLK
jgi:hypothetical protein